MGMGLKMVLLIPQADDSFLGAPKDSVVPGLSDGGGTVPLVECMLSLVRLRFLGLQKGGCPCWSCTLVAPGLWELSYLGHIRVVPLQAQYDPTCTPVCVCVGNITQSRGKGRKDERWEGAQPLYVTGDRRLV